MKAAFLIAGLTWASMAHAWPQSNYIQEVIASKRSTGKQAAPAQWEQEMHEALEVVALEPYRPPTLPSIVHAMPSSEEVVKEHAHRWGTNAVDPSREDAENQASKEAAAAAAKNANAESHSAAGQARSKQGGAPPGQEKGPNPGPKSPGNPNGPPNGHGH